jgi:hypothetical protein
MSALKNRTVSIEEFFHRRKREIAESLVAESADAFPALASQIKVMWDKLDREQTRGCCFSIYSHWMSIISDRIP